MISITLIDRGAISRAAASGAWFSLIFVLFLGCQLRCQQASAQSVEEFYQGKTIDLLIGYSPGGGYDAYARLLARNLGTHVPGKPKIIPRNMPGGGSRVATQYVYNVAPRNGTVLATGDQSLALEQALGVGSIRFDTTRFHWIGNVNSDNNTLVTWHTSGIRTIKDAKAREVPVGATGADPSSQYPKVMNALLGNAFDATIKDPAFMDEARKLNLSINPSSGAKLQQLVATIAGAPKVITGRLSNILRSSAAR